MPKEMTDANVILQSFDMSAFREMRDITMRLRDSSNIRKATDPYGVPTAAVFYFSLLAWKS